jgi:hypothetical protein
LRRWSSGAALSGLLAAVLAACSGSSTPYTTLRDLPLSGWQVEYHSENTANNGGCEDGNHCRAYGLISSTTETLDSLVGRLRQRGWSCAAPHSGHQAALTKNHGKWFVEFEQLADFVNEPSGNQAYFDDSPVPAPQGHGELAAARATDQDGAMVIELTHTTTSSKQEAPSSLGQCR